MFLFDLSITLSVPIHEIKQWPITIVDQYKAYNHLRHFTKNTDHELTGFIIELLRNQNITKKSDYKTAKQMMPFLSGELPDYLNDPRILKMRRQLSTPNLPKHVIDKFFVDLLEHIKDEIGKEEKDQYYIEELIKIYQEHNNNKEDE
ncbi:hypothetical protein ACL00O_06860 [Aeromonas sanarellii]|uniref:hypothetical protein n=1 Tax=Aeromonas sanarellii TaxID=633415 RepID=UPI0039A212D9